MSFVSSRFLSCLILQSLYSTFIIVLTTYAEMHAHTIPKLTSQPRKHT